MPLKKLFAACVDPRRRKREQKGRKRAFLENGGFVLERLVAACNGRPIPIRSFSCEELISATNNYHHDHALYTYVEGRFEMEFGGLKGKHLECGLYEGSLEGRSLCIKRYGEQPYIKDFALIELAISAKISAHKNILKLVGCCLETSNPTLVYEYAQFGVLSDRIYVNRPGTPMLWQSRLNIARQIAHAISYLHTAFSRPIIHRSIKMLDIFLDEHEVPKLSGFSLALSIPEGETHVKVDGPSPIFDCPALQCPNYRETGIVTEKVDVYAFGVVVLELLSGKPIYDLFQLLFIRDKWLADRVRNRAINECVDPAILAEKGGTGVEQQLHAVLELAVKCVEDDPEIRPTMVDVTKELRRIERSMA